MRGGGNAGIPLTTRFSSLSARLRALRPLR